MIARKRASKAMVDEFAERPPHINYFLFDYAQTIVIILPSDLE